MVLPLIGDSFHSRGVSVGRYVYSVVVLSYDDSRYGYFLGNLPQEGARKFLDLSVLDSEISIFFTLS